MKLIHYLFPLLLIFGCDNQPKDQPHQLPDSVRHRIPVTLKQDTVDKGISKRSLLVRRLTTALDPATVGSANDKATALIYNQPYAFGENPGWYGMNWTTQNIIDLDSKIGTKTFRMQLYDNFRAAWGWGALLPDYEHLNNIGAIGTAAMVGGVSPGNAWNPFNVAPAAAWDNPAGRAFTGMYLPIWNPDGSINPANTYAKYFYDCVQLFGKYVLFWEIWNEPDFSYHINGSGDAESEWMLREPEPIELWNLRATVPYYNRFLRISWEVVKKLYPKSFVCTGGIGTSSFLDAILRNTDNPDAGKVAAAFPLHGGAYFDVCSFHTYPEFSSIVKHWTNDDGGHQVYARHSDALAAGHMLKKIDLENVLFKFGYNGINYPRKHFICTETGVSRVMDNDNIGGNEVQKNYKIKAHVFMIRDGTIRQNYWYQTADNAPAGSGTHWDMFGDHLYFGDKFPFEATIADQGIAQRTTSKLLYGKIYDSVKTKSLNLPTTVDGGAFKGTDGYVYVLWAKTTTDMSEVASASITLPESNYTTTLWNGASGSVGNTTILTGTPMFFQPISAPTPPVVTDTTYTGRKGYWIINSKAVYYKVYTTQGKYFIKTGDYNWYKL